MQSVPLPSPRSYEPEPPSATPVYDALYAEFRRLFRALPGDRSGEEDLYFTGFGRRYPTAPASAAPMAPVTPAAPTVQTAGGYAAASGGMGRHRGYLALPPGRG
ncbi:hypothetical protein [Streptacidiphilus cavernicola]|uniref:Uncharacterized protein n=1 Tax=Streptacidiphilus cavernicola TaxID=3342716 RepID=A0ABV6W3X5_9ACTN